MSKYSAKQAKDKATQIHDRFGSLIHDACVGSLVPEDFLGGFVGVEAGVDKNGQIRTAATRFEPGVYHHLIAVRDGLLHSYDNVTHADIAGANDDAIKNLATSFGITQIMGWHCIHNLNCTIDELRDPNIHLHFAVQLLQITGGAYLRHGDFSSVLHIWNSGTANGKTYDPNYVYNALAVKAKYTPFLVVSSDQSAVSSGQEPEAPPETSESAVEAPAVDQPTNEPLVDPAVTNAGSATGPQDQAPPPTPEQKPETFFEKAQDEYGYVTGKLDTVTGVTDGVTSRTDSVKSLWTMVTHAIWQPVWAVFAFLMGLPKELWIVVAVSVAAFGLLYLYRQNMLGKIREQAKADAAAPPPQNS